MRTAGWWHLWLKRRRIDADRQWFGRGKYQREITRLGQGFEPRNLVGAGRPPLTEDTIVALLDVQAAVRRLAPSYQRHLALLCYGYTPREIGEARGVTANAVQSSLHQARQQVRKACA